MMAWLDYRGGRSRRSLLAQTLEANYLPVAASVVCVFCLVGSLLFIQRRLLQNEARLRAQSIAQVVAEQSVLAALLGDTLLLKEIAHHAMEVPDVLYVVIQPERTNDAVRETRSGVVPGQGSAALGDLTEEVADILASDEGSVMDWQARGAPTRLGTVTLGLSTARQMQTFRWFTLWTLGIAIFAYAGVLALQWRRTKNTLAPLGNLVEFTHYVSQGDLSQRAVVVKDDEVGHLAAACNEMVEALETSRRQLLLALGQAQESESRFRDLFERAPIAYHELDRDGIVLRVNQAECKLLGVDAESMVGRSILEFMAPEERPQGEAIMRRRLAGEAARAPFLRSFVRPDDSRVIAEIHSEIIRDQQGEVSGVRAALLDMTENRKAEQALRQAEDRLRQSQKMEAVGLLAGGIAHDFNNILTVILGRAELLLNLPPDGNPFRPGLTEIKAAGERASGLTRQLLTFSRKQILEPTVLSLNTVVADMETMLRRLLGEDVDVKICLEPKLGMAKCDRSQLEQLLLNLALNARDAMPDGGTLTIETANVELDPVNTGNHFEVHSEPHVMLAVSDNGQGMSAEVQSRIFEPFFTTKGLGRGTGLGLATVYGIVKQHGGNITVYSEPGFGATFKIYLPQMAGVLEPLAADAPEEAAPRGTETILLVEDEESVRSLIRDLLTADGYTLIEARDADEAILASEGHSDPIQMLITDVVLPGKNGLELAQRIQAERPDIKVLYTSGYTDNAIIHNGILRKELAFLRKPFAAKALRSKVRQVLDTRRFPAAVTVLLVDDEASSRMLLRDTLEEAGYRVLEARNGQEALQIANANHASLQLLLTDIMMPGAINGLGVAEQLRAALPHLKVLYVSGLDRSSVRIPLNSPEVAFLQKPFRLETLIRTVDKLMSRTNAGDEQVIDQGL
jgi:PAS domain S-box-containing protein